MESQFLTNTWYTAGWANELAEGFVARRILGTPILVFRTESGLLTCLEDRCPHRFAPLSRGKLKGEIIRCGYHGLGFDRDGKCIDNPLGGPIPSACKVRSFPVVEQDRALWVWFGQPEAADIKMIPRFPMFDDPSLRFVFGYTYAKCNYEMINDNLLDLAHATFLHPVFGGMDYFPTFKMEESNGTVWAKYVSNNMPSSLFFDLLWKKTEGKIDGWDDIRWDAPAVMYLESGATAQGRPRSEGYIIPAAHSLAPETYDTTHYFWASAVAKENPIRDEEYIALLRQAFDVEDVAMIEATYENMDGKEFWSRNPVLLKYDGAGIRARRLLKSLIDNENSKLKTEAKPFTSSSPLVQSAGL